MPLTLVRFLRCCAPYNAGETAGFLEAEASRLFQLGVAEPIEIEEAAQSEPLPEPEPEPAPAPERKSKKK